MSERFKAIRVADIEAELPEILSKTSDTLLQDLGEFDVAAHPSYAAIRNVTVPDFAAIGAFVAVRLRTIVCDAANKKMIDGTLTATNVAALAGLVLPQFTVMAAGVAAAAATPAVIPAPIVGFAVLVLRIGRNEYCKCATNPRTREELRHNGAIPTPTHCNPRWIFSRMPRCGAGRLLLGVRGKLGQNP